MRRIAIGGTEAHHRGAPGGKRLPFERHIGEDGATRELHRAVVAQQLVGDVRVEAGLAHEAIPLVAIAQQRVRTVPDQVDRRLVAGDEQQADLCEQLLVRQHVAGVLGRDEGGEEIVGRFAALPLEHVEQECVHAFFCVARGTDVVVAEDRVERLRHRVRPVPQACRIGLRHAEHARDDDKGEREREIADDVDRPRRVERVERGVDELFDERAQVGDDPRCEGFLHEPAQPGVIRGVGAEHRLGRWPPGPAQHLLDAIVEEIVVERDADRRIPQHPVDVVVAQEQPGAERRLLDRVLGADRRVDRIGIDEEIGTEQFVRSDHARTVA